MRTGAEAVLARHTEILAARNAHGWLLIVGR